MQNILPYNSEKDLYKLEINSITLTHLVLEILHLLSPSHPGLVAAKTNKKPTIKEYRESEKNNKWMMLCVLS